MGALGAASMPAAGRLWQVGRRLLLAWALLACTPVGPAGADSAVAPFLKPLHLVGYVPRREPPHFGGQTVDSRPISIRDLRGKVVLVNFWASWCAECRPEMPVLERLHRDLAREGFAVVGINAREGRAQVRRYATELRLTFPLVLDADGTINARYGVVGLPTTFLIGRDGRAVAFGVGGREWASEPARRLLQALLAEPVRSLSAE